MPEPPKTGLSHRMILFSLVALLSIILISIVLFCMAVLYRKQKKKYLYSTGRSVMTFSNPNYYTPNNEQSSAGTTTTTDKKFIWKRLKYDKSQVLVIFSQKKTEFLMNTFRNVFMKRKLVEVVQKLQV